MYHDSKEEEDIGVFKATTPMVMVTAADDGKDKDEDGDEDNALMMPRVSYSGEGGGRGIAGKEGASLSSSLLSLAREQGRQGGREQGQGHCSRMLTKKQRQWRQ